MPPRVRPLRRRRMSNDAPSGADDRPDRRPDVEWVTLDGEVVLYDPTASVVHRLNPAAAAVWAACDGTASLQGITSAIEDAYSGPPGEIARDVPAVIARFRQLGLLRPSPAVGGAAC
jgi:Coenzyme PQQ synthesis protein D (PqqD)